MNQTDKAYKVAEKFVSINGEGVKAGQLAVFIRFKGCNLSCDYCDTKWANEPETPYTEMTCDQITEYILETGVENVTLTGGEPLLQPEIAELVTRLAQKSFFVEIETNGSIALKNVLAAIDSPNVKERLSFTMDYKLGGSGMEAFMNPENFQWLRSQDTVKFVVGSSADLEKTEQVIKKYGLVGNCHIYISLVFGAIEPAKIVDYMKEHQMNGVNMQLQMHKFIWNPQQRGV